MSRKSLSLMVALIVSALSPTQALAGEADVADLKVSCTAARVCNFDITSKPSKYAAFRPMRPAMSPMSQSLCVCDCLSSCLQPRLGVTAHVL